MGIKRSNWTTTPKDHPPIIRTDKSGVRPVNANTKTPIIGVSGKGGVINQVSEFRRGMFAENNTDSVSSITPLIVYSPSYKANQKLKQEFSKTAAVSGVGSTFGQSSSSSTVRQAPEVYSPLFQMANLQLPRDRITMNAWNRNFYITHPLVHNCINLHATYPISKINIKCKDAKIEQFFNDMAEDMDLVGTLQTLALGFWTIGEVFAYAQLDEKTGRWKSIESLNPDYVHVKKSVVGSGVSLSMRPDAALLKLIQSSSPDDRRMVEQIDPEIIYHVRKGNNIPLDNFHVSHLKNQADPSDVHGTSIIVSIYKDLMLYDKLRECYSEDTEVLTDEGFRRWEDLIVEDTVSGPQTKAGVKIACFNPTTEQIEYHAPTHTHLSDYTGDMYHFNGKKVDVLVTPNHRMWESRKLSKGWSNWEFKQAQELSMGTKYRFRSTASWAGEDKKTVEVCGKQMPIELYLKVLGYVISEGCVHIGTLYTHAKNHKQYRHYSVGVCQKITSDCFDDMRESFIEFGKIIGRHVCQTINKNDVWTGSMNCQDITLHFHNELNTNGKCKSVDKHIPRWALSLNPRLLEILLFSLVRGDGAEQQNKNGVGFKYFTISNALADDVQEVALKCGFASNKYKSKNGAGKEYWVVSWTDDSRGRFPNIYGNTKHRDANITKVPYSGKVWCFEVPTGLFITRRSGKITIQGNSKFAQADNLINPITLIKVGGTEEGEFHPTNEDLESFRQIFEAATYDKDFKIITHAGVKVERVGASGQIIDIAPDMTFILDNICFGLMVPKTILTQEAAAFSSASIGLEVLKQRYESFRNMMSRWLIRKIFAPISELQEFYSYKDGEKKLIVPEVWNKLALYDTNDYISAIKELANNPQNPVVSKSTLFKSLGLSEEEEVRQIKSEAIQTVILQKELAILQNMSLGALRALNDGAGVSDIIEPTEPLGQGLPGTPGSMPEESGMPGLGGPEAGGGLGELGLPPTPPPTPASTTPPPAPTTPGPTPKV